MRDDLLYGDWFSEYGESNDRDFLVTATIQVIVPARTRVDARIIAADTLRAYITDSPYPNDPMNGLTIDDVEDLSIEEGII